MSRTWFKHLPRSFKHVRSYHHAVITIGDDRADFDVLLQTMHGVHSPSRKEAMQQVLCGIVGLTMAAIVGWVFFSDPSQMTGWYPWAGAGIIIASLYGAAICLVELPTVYAIDAGGIEKRNPLPMLRWHLPVSEFHRVEVDIVNTSMLTIHTSTDRKIKMPLIGGALSGMATLYPALFGPPEPINFSVRPRLLIALAVIVAATIAIVMYAIRLLNA